MRPTLTWKGKSIQIIMCSSVTRSLGRCAQYPYILTGAWCTVWAAISERGIIGPLRSRENERYVEVLDKFWDELQSLYPAKMGYFWFQQDGASPHTSHFYRNWLKEYFGKGVISRFAEVEWASHSPDLSTPDFYLWGYLKSKVYANKPRTISELKLAIRDEIKYVMKN